MDLLVDSPAARDPRRGKWATSPPAKRLSGRRRELVRGGGLRFLPRQESTHGVSLGRAAPSEHVMSLARRSFP